MPGHARAGTSGEHESNDFETLKRLHQDEQRQWFVLAAVTVLVTVALAVSVAPALGEALENLWPWARTDIVLLGGFGLSIAMLVGYLTWQQKKARAVRERVQRMAEESARRERQNTERLRALLNVSRMMGSATSRDGVFAAITQTCLETFDCQQASLMLVDDDHATLRMKAATGHTNPDSVKDATTKVGDGIAGWVAQTRQPLILNRDTDMSRYPTLRLKNDQLCAAMVVPVVVRDELIGVLNVSSRSQQSHYSTEDLQALLVFAENVGTSIRHVEHLEWMRSTIQQLQSARDSQGQVHDITT